MEFPKLGKYCAKLTCNKFDFLPIKCDACHLDFCVTHIRYEAHNCQYVRKKNIPTIETTVKILKQPEKSADTSNVKLNKNESKDPIRNQVCPVCNKIQENCVLRGNKDDLTVGYVYKNKAYRNDSPTIINPSPNIENNVCSFKACKQKEMLKLICPHCSRNYCKKHKHPIDHLCNGLKFKRGSAVFKENLTKV
ncbi:AN1-type zinc finger protein 2A-like [Diorhabda carinulata]|uniref:AN1-type zinc finger protein 2A-like n=1 Tax=Diorhabda carinulata TaxID=1163345 RepID=UPI0025A197AA|nr:AN1-type zinc finger protein 2A-like [Diorhabda carinulata]